MKPVIAALLVFLCATASGQNYQCPQVYPGKDRPALPLTGAAMAWGEDRTGLFAGDYSKPAEGGYDAAYPIMGDEQAWLICSYGSKKRNKGTVRNGREWNQSMTWGPTEWWVRLDPHVHDCNVQVREAKIPDSRQSNWSATAICARQ